VEDRILDDIPSSISQVISASKDDMILFSERLLHGGGLASTYKDSEERDTLFSAQCKKVKWLQGRLHKEHPTDVAIQITFDYNLVSSGAKTGRASNIWAFNETSDKPVTGSDVPKRLGMLASTVDDANDQFIKTMKETKTAWIKSIVEQKQYTIANKRGEG